MNNDLRKNLELKSLKATLGVESYNAKEKKAIKNIKFCANDQWQFVNSYIDGETEVRPTLLDAKGMFDTIYSESQENIYDEGFVSFGTSVSMYMRDVRFCGKEFLQKVSLYYTAKLMEDILVEVEATDEECEKVLDDLRKIKNEVFGIHPVITNDPINELFVEGLKDGDAVIVKLAEMLNINVKKTKKSENWISLDEITAEIFKKKFYLSVCFSVGTKGQKTEISNENVKFILKTGKNAYLWCVK